MVASKELTKTDPKYDKIPVLPTCMYKLYKEKNSVIVTVQVRGCNRTYIPTNNKLSYPRKSYVEGLASLGYWRIRKSKDNITRYG